MAIGSESYQWFSLCEFSSEPAGVRTRRLARPRYRYIGSGILLPKIILDGTLCKCRASGGTRSGSKCATFDRIKLGGPDQPPAGSMVCCETQPIWPGWDTRRVNSI